MNAFIGQIVLCGLVVAVHNLLCIGIRSRRITEYCMDTAVGRSCRINPAALYITVATVCHTGTGERTCYTEVIDATAELAEQ